ncbi:fibronectin type III domain-containing protein [Microscilla marina]|uniref:Fibronectin type III domain protein n=2 Tax=Microscilla marina ATCC 23134 TaxID=313606 RepID=A2A0C1_MICM2|nr:fibronectin type III domain-containing protein [Microscilla marina]EAY23913.1 fibronectin type III domain protein [Microscilla marina ATCC 23134]
MRIHLFKCLLIVGALLLGASDHTTAQRNYSVKLIATVSPPHSPFLHSYSYSSALTLHLILNGVTAYAGYLRIKLESMDGRGIVIQTRANYLPLLDLGPSQTMNGSDLSDYFDVSNLDFQGYSRQQYLKTKRIPDGIYKLTFSFVDRYRPSVSVSNVDILSEKTLRVFALQPPILNFPLMMSQTNRSNQSLKPIPISWTRPANTPFNPEYELVLNELRPDCQNQYANINANNQAASRISQGEIFNCLGPEIFRTSTTSLIYNYGMQAEPMLGLGKWYAIRIQARDPQGRTLFINDGVSQIRVFRYGKPCPIPIRLKATALNPYQVQLDWDALPDHTGYTVHFKREGDAYKWYTQRALSNRTQINDMEPGVSYSFKLTANCNAFGSEETATVDFRMPTPKPTGVQCGKPLVVDLSNQRPISNLRVGDKIMAADFEFTLVEVKPLGGGWFAGRAYTHINYFQGARVFARFDRIKINTDKRLIDGELTTTGAGTQIIPDEWRDQYLSFTGEINNLFDEIERGLDKIDQVVGKIDQVLKKVEQWVKNYNGPDKAELLETIQIGKKAIEEGKKDWKDGKLTEAAKKLKDGSGKVLGAAAKMVKNTLEKLLRDLKDLLKEALDALRGRSKAEKEKLAAQKKKDWLAYQKLRAEVVIEDQGFRIKVNGADSTLAPSGQTTGTEVKNDLFPETTHVAISQTEKAKAFDEKVNTLLEVYQKFDFEKLRFDQILVYINDPGKFGTLLEKVKKSMESLGEELLEDLSQNKLKLVKAKIETEVNKIIDDLVKEFYEKESKK